MAPSSDHLSAASTRKRPKSSTPINCTMFPIFTAKGTKEGHTLVDRPIQLFYIWICICCCKYTNLKDTAWQFARHTPTKLAILPRGGGRDQREWVFEVREVKSENKKLSLFFEKCKVKKKCFHSFSRSAK